MASEVKRVIAVDPGKATGIAWWSSDGHIDTATYAPEEMYTYFTLRPAVSVHRLVWEKFIITPATAKNSPQTWSLEHIGLMKAWAWVYHIETTAYSASQAKQFTSNEVIRRMGWWERGQTDHERDALRHLYLYLVSSRLVEPVSL